MNRSPRIKYRFGDAGFTSQAGVMKHAAALRERYRPAQTIDMPGDIAFLRDLVASHIHSEGKTGVGIHRFYYAPAPHHPTVCFWLERADGSKTDFGVPACLKKIAQLNKQSLRDGVASQLAIFRSKRLVGQPSTFVSDYSGKEFPTSEAVVDHVVPFDSIIGTFFSSKGVDIHTEMLTRSVDADLLP